MNPTTRAVLTVTAFAAGPAVVVGIVVLFVAGPIAGPVVCVAVGLVLAAWARWGGDRRVTALIGGRPADPRLDPRLCNLVEGLSITAGVRQPKLRVIDSPGLNALAAGTSPARAVIAVTSGLLAELDRIELEAVLAEELAQLRHNDTFPGTVLVATFGLWRSLALPGDFDAGADQRAVSVTRYPPALASALEKIESKGSAVAGIPSYAAHLWLADPTGSATLSRGRLSLSDRIEAVREL